MTEMTHPQQAQALSRFRRSAEKVREEDLSQAVEGSEDKVKRLERKIPKPLTTVWERILLMIRVIKAYVRGEYREVPWGTVAAITASLLYFVCPIDVITDFLPVLGYIDDAVVIGFSMKLIDKDLKNFETWEHGRLPEKEPAAQTA
jgi:uncharacterized membrane protein YkvA (DUF1232 family)